MDTYDIHRRILADPVAPDAGHQPGPRVKASTLAPAGTLAWYSVGESSAVGAALSWVVLDRFIDEEEELGYHTLGGVHRQYVRHKLSVLNQYELPFTVPLPMPSLAGAYRWRDFYFGVGVSLRATSFDLSFLRDTALEQGRAGIEAPCDPDGVDQTPCGIENPAATERYDIRVSTAELLTTRNIVLNGGVMWQIAPAWWLGVHYQSPPGFLSSLSLAGSVRIAPAPYQDPTPESFGARAEVIYQLPQTIAGGLRRPAFGDFDLFAAVRWQSLSRQRLLDIRLLDPTRGSVPEWMTRYRGFDDTLTITAALEQHEGAGLRLGARLQVETETTPPAAVSPLQVDGLQPTAALGGELRLFDRPRLVLYASYGLTYYPTVTTGEDIRLRRLRRIERQRDQRGDRRESRRHGALCLPDRTADQRHRGLRGHRHATAATACRTPAGCRAAAGDAHGIPQSGALPRHPVGSTSGVVNILFTNTAAGNVTFNTPAIGAASGDASDFLVASPTSGTAQCISGRVMAPGTSCSFGVQFSPRAAGARSATWTVNFTGAVAPRSLTMQGTSSK